MPIGGIVACEDAVIPNAVGVDIGCGMAAVRTTIDHAALVPGLVTALLEAFASRVPVGEGNARSTPLRIPEEMRLPSWLDGRGRDLAARNLGTLGGGNHYIEIQVGGDGVVWFMVHTGSRNLGYRIANHHNEIAIRMRGRFGTAPPDLAFLPVESEEGRSYLTEMESALRYAALNRKLIVDQLMEAALTLLGGVAFPQVISIHHNYASLETHFGRRVWVHRKGATSALSGQLGIIPGSMGSPSYIVRGLGNPDSFMSCAHGAGRRLGRREAQRTLSAAECERAMAGIVHGTASAGRLRGFRSGLDISEAPQAYKDIEDVMRSQADLVEPVVRLLPLGVLKG
jgi:tRNA-splicing ligase RtcB